jgi:hypothetical protein
MKKLFFGLLFWLLSAPLALAAVAISNTSTQAFADFSTSPQSATVATGTAAADRVMFVYLYNVDNTGSGATINTVTLGGVTLTKVTGSYVTRSGAIGSAVEENVLYWGLVTSGTTGTLSITFNAVPGDNSTSVLIYRTTGADTTTPVSSSGNDNTGAGVTLTVPTSGAMLAGASVTGLSTPSFTSWSGVTSSGSLTNVTNSGFVKLDSEGGTTTSSGSTTAVGTWSGAATTALTSAVIIQQASAGGTVNKNLMMMGVGQ